MNILRGGEKGGARDPFQRAGHNSDHGNDVGYVVDAR